MARLYVLTGCRSVLGPTCIYCSILALFFSGFRFVCSEPWADIEGETGGPDSPEKSQKYRVA